jgi:hypothetical protein
MATDIRRMTKEDLDEMNRQIAICRADRATAEADEKRGDCSTPGEQLQLFGEDSIDAHF